ncbi:hypothetical protein GEMRC1_001109 [Eukaryota sp. GEM-RC1]
MLIGFGDPREYCPVFSKTEGEHVIQVTGDLLHNQRDLVSNISDISNSEIFTSSFCISISPIFENSLVKSIKIKDFKPIPSLLTSSSSPFFYTEAQFFSIISALCPGLSMVVGPPGTGKSDVASQVVASLLQSSIINECSSSRVLVITHSNDALNQLFEKVVDRGVDVSRLVRLGHGESRLSTSGQDFSREGRVAAVLAKRSYLIDTVNQLVGVIGLTTVETCESALIVLDLIDEKWKDFLIEGENAIKNHHFDFYRTSCPLLSFFQTVFNFSFQSQSLPSSQSATDDLNTITNQYQSIIVIRNQLREIHPFEVLPTPNSRGDFIVTNYSKVVAMTVTHATLKLKWFVENNFKFDSFIMEESAQCVELDAVIPFLCNTNTEVKRILLIGDHNQLPPVIKNTSLIVHSNADQTLFTRLLALGASAITLDRQGRCKPELAKLFSWKYDKLNNFNFVETSPEFTRACPGFKYDCQLINVEEYFKKGEHEPRPYFFQNLGEAEYVIQTYMFMRKIGYPAEKISILTTYIGQKN